MRVGSSMTDVVGRTPVVQLRKVVPEGAADVFVKLEWFNPTGSYKDRMALSIGEREYCAGRRTPDAGQGLQALNVAGQFVHQRY